MDPINELIKGKELFDQLGGDPQTVFTVLNIVKVVDNDPQKIHAILSIAKFLSKKD